MRLFEDYHGALVTGGYAAYDGVAEARTGGQIGLEP